MRRLIITLLLLYTFVNSCFAQNTDSVPARKPWYLTFNLDIKAKSLQGKFNDYYQGEYYNSPTTTNPEGYWKWIETKKANKKLFPGYSFYDIKMDVLVGRSKGLRFGMSYNFGLLEHRKDSVYNFYSYLAISGIAEYQYNFIKEKELSPFVFGSIAFGAYRGDASLEGPGTELFGQARAGAGLAMPGGYMIRFWTSADVLRYREKGTSQIFNKTQYINTDMQLVYLGLGFTKQFTLIPD
jgi:hypothetical protein